MSKEIKKRKNYKKMDKWVNSILCILIFLTMFYLFGAFLEYDFKWIDFKNDESDRILFLGALIAPTFLCLTVGPYKIVNIYSLITKIQLLKYKNKSNITLK